MATASEFDTVYRYNLDTGEISTLPVAGEGNVTSLGAYTSSLLPGNKMVYSHAHHGPDDTDELGLRRVVVDLDTLDIEQEVYHPEFFEKIDTSGIGGFSRSFIFGDTIVEYYSSSMIAGFNLLDGSLIWKFSTDSYGGIHAVRFDSGSLGIVVDASPQQGSNDEDWYIVLLNPHTGDPMVGPVDLDMQGTSVVNLVKTVKGVSVVFWAMLPTGDAVLLVVNVDGVTFEPELFYVPLGDFTEWPTYARITRDVVPPIYSPINNTALLHFSSNFDLWVDFNNETAKIVSLEPTTHGRALPTRDGGVLITGRGNSEWDEYNALFLTNKSSDYLWEVDEMPPVSLDYSTPSYGEQLNYTSNAVYLEFNIGVTHNPTVPDGGVTVTGFTGVNSHIGIDDVIVAGVYVDIILTDDWQLNGDVVTVTLASGFINESDKEFEITFTL